MRLAFVWGTLVMLVIGWVGMIVRLYRDGKSPADNYVVLIQAIFIALACAAIAFP